MIAAQVPLVLGFSLFIGRNGAAGGAAQSPALFVWERSGWLAAVFLTALGLILLEGTLVETKCGCWHAWGLALFSCWD